MCRVIIAEQMATTANTQAAAAATIASSTAASRPATAITSSIVTTGNGNGTITSSAPSPSVPVPVLVALTAASVAAANPQDSIPPQSTGNNDEIMTMVTSLRTQISDTTTVHSNKIISLEADLQAVRDEFATRVSVIENTQRTQVEHVSRQCDKNAKESRDACKQNGRMTDKLLVVVSDQQKRTERVTSQMDFLQRYTLENQPPGDRAMSDPLSLFNRLISLSTPSTAPLVVPSLPYAHPLPPQSSTAPSALSSPHHLRSRTSPSSIASSSTLTSPLPAAALVITTNNNNGIPLHLSINVVVYYK
jgi:hypothetical protein